MVKKLCLGARKPVVHNVRGLSPSFFPESFTEFLLEGSGKKSFLWNSNTAPEVLRQISVRLSYSRWTKSL